MDSLNHGVWRCRYLCRRMKVRVFRSLVLPVLLYGCETLTLTKGLRWRLNSFGTRSLQRIIGYHWSDFVSNEQLLRETQMRFVTCIVVKHQLWLYGHVAQFPDTDPERGSISRHWSWTFIYRTLKITIIIINNNKNTWWGLVHKSRCS